MKPKQEWSFTDTPDFPRICRELEDAGLAVGLVTIRPAPPALAESVTLIDTRKARAVPGMRRVVGAPAHWRVASGDCTKAALGISPVRVQGYPASALSRPEGPPPAECAADERRQLDQLAKLRNQIANKINPWTTQDGTRVAVASMSDAHLHYALAKAYRNEYPASLDRAQGIEALRLEAARRLAPARPAPATPEPEYSDSPGAIQGRWSIVYTPSCGGIQSQSWFADPRGYASRAEAERALARIIDSRDCPGGSAQSRGPRSPALTKSAPGHSRSGARRRSYHHDQVPLPA